MRNKDLLFFIFNVPELTGHDNKWKFYLWYKISLKGETLTSNVAAGSIAVFDCVENKQLAGRVKPVDFCVMRMFFLDAVCCFRHYGFVPVGCRVADVVAQESSEI